MRVALTAVVVVDRCDLVSIAKLVVRAGLVRVFVVVSNLDNGGLFDDDLVGGTRVLRARALVDSDTAAFC